jgi:Flp pilus assembly protein TadB
LGQTAAGSVHANVHCSLQGIDRSLGQMRELSALLVALVVVVVAYSTPPTRAAGLLSNVLASHMVLQRVPSPHLLKQQKFNNSIICIDD